MFERHILKYQISWLGLTHIHNPLRNVLRICLLRFLFQSVGEYLWERIFWIWTPFQGSIGVRLLGEYDILKDLNFLSILYRSEEDVSIISANLSLNAFSNSTIMSLDKFDWPCCWPGRLRNSKTIDTLHRNVEAFICQDKFLFLQGVTLFTTSDCFTMGNSLWGQIRDSVI